MKIKRASMRRNSNKSKTGKNKNSKIKRNEKFKSISNKSKKSSNNKAKKQKNKLEQEILLLNEVFKKEPPRCKNKGLDYPCCCTFDPKTRHHKCYKSLNQCDPNPLKGTLGYKLGKK